MPVNATPLTVIDNSSCLDGTPSVAAAPLADCLNQRVFSGKVPIDPGTGKLVLSRMRNVTVPVGPSTLEWVMHTVDGRPIDLSECSCGGNANDCTTGPILKLAEYVLGESVASIVGEFVDTAAGKVRVNLPANFITRPGVYFAEFGIGTWPTTEKIGNPTTLSVTNQFYLTAQRSLFFAGTDALAGPPTIPEVRLHLRDSGPAESYLLDNVRFTDEEIAHCTRLPIQYWNEIPPPVGMFDSYTFPFRYHWLQAICGYLFLIVAEQQRANNIQYAAGGIQLNDQNKEPNYEQAGQARLADWKNFVYRKKIEMNTAAGWGDIASCYSGIRP